MTFTSIAGGGVAKTLMAVTISVHPAAAHHHAGSRQVTVRPGDTLSSISKREYGSAARWPALWWTNRDRVSNPSNLRVGQRLSLSDWHPAKPWITEAAMEAIPAPRPVAPAAEAAPAPVASAPVASAPAPPSGTYSASSGSYQNCVIQAESGGNASAVNPSTGAGGLYGFLPSTWQALGYSGLPQNAPVSVQNAAFAKEYARSGSSAWSPSDGC